ncbi:MAG: hypothetical protein AAF411_00490 [Myxococcota bacterium]
MPSLTLSRPHFRGLQRHTAVYFLLALSALTNTASAQRTNVRDTGFRDQTIVDDTLNRRGRIELGANLAGALSFGSSTPEGGDSVSQSNLYVTGSLFGGYMILDNLELRLNVGMQFLGRTVGDDSITAPSFVGAVQALYQRDLILGLGIYAGVGGGGFYGSRTQEVTGGLEQRFTSFGGLAQVLLGLMVMPGPRLVLRGGLRADFLIGSESADEAAGIAGSESSFFTTQVLFDVSFGVRFGG